MVSKGTDRVMDPKIISLKDCGIISFIGIC
jgi:hypothetical protein